jgi:hypothetical protein
MRKVAGSIPFGVIGIFHCLVTSGRTVALGSTSACDTLEHQGYLLGGKGGQCVGLTTLPPSYADCLRNYGSISLLEPSKPVQACNVIALRKDRLKVNRNGLVGAVTRVWVGRAGFRIPTGAKDFYFLQTVQTVSGVKELGLGIDH